MCPVMFPCIVPAFIELFSWSQCKTVGGNVSRSPVKVEFTVKSQDWCPLTVLTKFKLLTTWLSINRIPILFNRLLTFLNFQLKNNKQIKQNNTQHLQNCRF